MPEYAGLIKYPSKLDVYGGDNQYQWLKDLATTAAAEAAQQASGRSPVGHTHSTLTNETFSVDLSSAGAFALRSGSSNMVQWDASTGVLVAGSVPWGRLSDVPVEDWSAAITALNTAAA